MKKKGNKVKPTRTISGVAPVTIFTKPYACSGNCIFCPTEENIPKSYLSEEPGIQRANMLKYDPYVQVKKRIQVLEENGHNANKVEIIISGGTWDDYPLEYRKNLILQTYRALNDLRNKTNKDKDNHNPDNNSQSIKNKEFEDIKKVQKINETAAHRCIGMSIETRPDKISIDTVKDYRRFGVTKVQIGVQTLNPEILEMNSRGHTVQDTYNAIRVLRANGFKIQVHWMCNLYRSNPRKDYEDFLKLFNDPKVKPDELKIYPCSLLQNTALYKKFKEGSFEPYSTEELINLLSKCKLITPEYCRINRVFRDIPSGYIVAGHRKTNLREMIWKDMAEKDWKCQCIRCREIRKKRNENLKPHLNIIKYQTDISTDYFLQYITSNHYIIGFLRLSIYNKGINKNEQIVDIDAMIREIHVYGPALKFGASEDKATQHQGFGTKLIKKAEQLAKKENANILGVIASIGTRNYYRKREFTIEDEFGYGVKKIN